MIAAIPFVGDTTVEKLIESAERPVVVAFIRCCPSRGATNEQKVEARMVKLLRVSLMKAFEKWEGKCWFVKVLVDENPDLTERLKPKAAPYPFTVVIRRGRSLSFAWDDFDVLLKQGIEHALEG